MKTFALLMVLAAGLAAAKVSTTDAPADAYFGRLKYSALRVRYTTQQLKQQLELHKRFPNDVAHMAAFSAEAFYDWARRYPRDRWLDSTGYSIAKLYEELPGADARAQAIKLLTFIKRSYPSTRYARLSASELAHGIALRPYPAWAITPTPAPTPALTPSPSSTPSASPSPGPLRSPR